MNDREIHMKLYKICIQTLFTACLVASCKGRSNSTNQSAMKASQTQEVRLSLTDKSISLDPRQTRGLESINLTRMLFEGLTFVDTNGKILPGIAQNIKISPDIKTFTFSLRDCNWSNGDKIRAQDFEYAWKTALAPQTKSPMSYMLFAIKGAKNYFEGSGLKDDIGIKAIDDKTLEVTLENPTPYFLQLTATPAFFPVNQSWVEAHPEWKENDKFACVSNGVFALDSYAPESALILKKNSEYWGKETVKLDKVTLSVMDAQSAKMSFEKGALDWVGTPFSILGLEGTSLLKQSGEFKSTPAAGTQFLRVNVDKPPFNSAKIRKAFCMAIDSQAICEQIMQGEQKPAIGFVPPGMGLQQKNYFVPHDVEGARRLLTEALTELNMTKETLPTISLSYISSDRAQKIAEAIRQNWKDAFNIDVTLQANVASSFYDQIFNKEYQLACGSWLADYFDPMSFLSVFQYKDNGTNNTGWSNVDYARLLDQSNLEMDPVQRMALLSQAEEVLMNDLPIMPLFHFAVTYAKNARLQATKISPMCFVDFDTAYILENPDAPAAS